MDIKRITCVENLKDNFFVDTWGNLYKEENCELVKMKLYKILKMDMNTKLSF